MHKNGYKKRIVILSISLFITLLIIGVGVAYSYFAMSLRNLETSSTILVDSGSVSYSFEGGENSINANNITPGWSGYKYFSITSINKTSKTYTYNINLYVDSSNFDIANEPGNSYLSYQLFKCNSQGNGCTTSLSNGIVNRNFYEISLYQESISKTTAGTKYYSLVLNYPKDDNNVQSQYGPDGKLFNFAGHITITSDDRLSQ